MGVVGELEQAEDVADAAGERCKESWIADGWKRITS